MPHPLRHPLAHVQARVAHWWQNRLPLTDSVTLTQRNVYIMPTRAGLMLGITLLVLLVAAINYQLNLGYLLTFLLAGSALVGMHIGHGTLRGLTLNLTAPEAIHLGTKAIFSIHLHNARKRTRYGIGLAVLGAEQWAWTDVAGQASAAVQLAFMPARRGRHQLPTLTAETRFPLGTFRVWTLWRPAAQVLVYPAPEVPAPALPEGQAHEGSAHASATSVQGEADGLRAYRRGDALKTIVWKKAAKTGELVSRDSQTLQQQTLWLDQQHTGLSQSEAQLSRLCAWVLQAEQLGLIYGLHLKHQDIAPASGPAHQQRCLQALALA
ncbi:MAG: DUF58 domain-containing protein [Betaproteobacteria bacterium HGW-Betaproteobacteria-18]|nr:MAG: DUF58 domain-containing protein [Betaproteobacteria bacterium HGW-Betaproteobacteria-18]